MQVSAVSTALHGLEIDVCTVRRAGRTVTQVVQPNRWQPGLEDQVAAGQVVRVQRRPVLGDEHVAAVLPGVPRRSLLGALPAAMLAQQPTRSRLRRADRDQVAVGDVLLLDHRESGVEVRIGARRPHPHAAPRRAISHHITESRSRATKRRKYQLPWLRSGNPGQLEFRSRPVLDDLHPHRLTPPPTLIVALSPSIGYLDDDWPTTGGPLSQVG